MKNMKYKIIILQQKEKIKEKDKQINKRIRIENLLLHIRFLIKCFQI